MMFTNYALSLIAFCKLAMSGFWPVSFAMLGLSLVFAGLGSLAILSEEKKEEYNSIIVG